MTSKGRSTGTPTPQSALLHALRGSEIESGRVLAAAWELELGAALAGARHVEVDDPEGDKRFLNALTRLAAAAIERGTDAVELLEELAEVVEHAARNDADLRERWTADALDAIVALTTSDPVPRHTVEQVRRRGRHRAQLLNSGAYDIEALVSARGPTRGAVDSWLSREHAAHRLLRVQDRSGKALVPAILLDASGDRLETFTGIAPTLRTLAEAGLSDWAAWTWLATPAGWAGTPDPRELLEQQRWDELAAAALRFTDSSPDRALIEA